MKEISIRRRWHYWSIYPSIAPYLPTSLPPSFLPSIHASTIHQSIHQPIHPSIHSFFHSIVHLFHYPAIHTLPCVIWKGNVHVSMFIVYFVHHQNGVMMGISLTKIFINDKSNRMWIKLKIHMTSVNMKHSYAHSNKWSTVQWIVTYRYIKVILPITGLQGSPEFQYCVSVILNLPSVSSPLFHQ